MLRTMPNFIIEPAGIADAEKVVELLAMADEDALLELTSQSSLQAAKAVYMQHFSNPRVYFNYQNILTAKCGQNIAGCILFFEGKYEEQYLPISGQPRRTEREAEWDELYIDSVAVDPHYRGQGIAAQLIERVFENAAQIHCAKVSLLVDLNKPHLMRYYRKFGFADAGYVDLGYEWFLKMACPIR